ncbi:MAG: glutamate--tRNA ligase [Candidatus Terrybacteria bacterium]|nr:glutamate--tRNA ligase [Candidatus Terrybacteria bacterium]
MIITRFAPSPTGVLHLGGARTALFNFLFARQNKGKFILRIEDTDPARSKKEYEDDITNGLKWLGLEWDEFYRQSDRKEIYKKYLKKLIEEDKAYVSKETRGQRESVIRFRNPGRKIVFEDLIRGEIEFDTAELGDFVIAKDEESPLYHLAVVVDDFEMKISHIIRGEDGISNTPRQILIQEAIKAPRPIYAHIPLILGPDRSKLSKRHGAVSVSEYRQEGYLPEAIINFIAFIGWNPGDEREILNLNELIKDFSLEKVQRAGAIFNIQRLNWMSKEYIKKKDIDELAELCEPYIKKLKTQNSKLKINDVIKLQQERINKLSEVGEGIDYFFEEPEYKKELLIWRDSTEEKIAAHLEHLSKILCDIQESDFNKEKIKEAIWKYAEEQGRGDVLWSFRVALTGLEKSPNPFIIAEILGKEETLRRLKIAKLKIQK